MAQTIIRAFDSLERAQAAAAELENNRALAYKDVHVVAAGPDAGPDSLTEALCRVMVLKAQARAVAAALPSSGAVVVVHAPFGTARMAIEMLDKRDPIDAGLPEERSLGPGWDDATPMSCALGMPVLLSEGASFSKFWGLPLLVRSGRTTSSGFGLRELKATPARWSHSLGLPLLSNKAAPLSSMLGLPLLKR